GPFGAILPEALFLGWLQAADGFELVQLAAEFVDEVRPALAAHPLGGADDAARLRGGVPLGAIEAAVAGGRALPLCLDGRLVGAGGPRRAARGRRCPRGAAR